jgi:protoheme IX farnesyltransferase
LKAIDSIEKQTTISMRLRDLAMLFKVRLTIIVVLSALLGYFMGTSVIDLGKLLALTFGGFLLTGASNGLNQVWERDLDKLMNRTMNRPLPTGRMSTAEGLIISLVSGFAGVFILWYFLNTIAGVLGLLAIFSYVLLYTPLKQKSAIAVFVGAFPGAIPPMLGYVAATSDFDVAPGLLFATQFMWQFPHFWAIAWVADEDYRRAGYKLLPFASGQTKSSAFQIFLYSMMLIPVSLLPWVFPLEAPMIGNWAFAGVLLAGLGFAYTAWKLYISCDMKDAKKVMFASFIYLPIVQILYVLDKLTL